MTRADFLRALALAPLIGVISITRRPIEPMAPVKNGDYINAKFLNDIINRLNQLAEQK